MSKSAYGAKRKPPSKDKVVPIRVTPDQHAQIAALAAADGRSMTNFMRRMCERGMEDYLQKQAPSAA